MFDAIIEFVVRYPVTSVLAAALIAILGWAAVTLAWRVAVGASLVFVLYFGFLLVTGREPPDLDAFRRDGAEAVEESAEAAKNKARDAAVREAGAAARDEADAFFEEAE